jgi:hypothetical protein
VRLRSPPRRADKNGMAALAAEPLSPELALVCPELRARAIAALPELPWLEVRRSAPDEHAEAEDDAVLAPLASICREAATYALALAGRLGIAAAGVVLLTLALTILAALRY